MFWNSVFLGMHLIESKRSTMLNFLVFLALLLIGTPILADDETVCTSYLKHPLYNSSEQPVLIKCWSYMTMPKEPMTFYKVRHLQHRYAPMDDPTSKIFSKLDWFWASNGQGVTDDFVKLHFNRIARVHLLVPIHKYSDMDSPSLPGWNPLGPAVLVKGEGRPLIFGTFQKYKVLSSLSEKMYVFTREGSDVVLPHHSWVWNNLKGFKIPSMMPWIVMVSERDGTMPIYPSQPARIPMKIRPNRRCPQALHDLWVTPNTDSTDTDTAGKLWKTWHPTWDTMFWW